MIHSVSARQTYGDVNHRKSLAGCQFARRAVA